MGIYTGTTFNNVKVCLTENEGRFFYEKWKQPNHPLTDTYATNELINALLHGCETAGKLMGYTWQKSMETPLGEFVHMPVIIEADLDEKVYFSKGNIVAIISKETEYPVNRIWVPNEESRNKTLRYFKDNGLVNAFNLLSPELIFKRGLE